MGLEGIVSKRTDAPYRSGRSRTWLKSKNPESAAVRREREEELALSRIARLGQWAALPDQCLHSAEADVRPPRRKSGFDPEQTMATRGDCCASKAWRPKALVLA